MTIKDLQSFERKGYAKHATWAVWDDDCTMNQDSAADQGVDWYENHLNSL